MKNYIIIMILKCEDCRNTLDLENVDNVKKIREDEEFQDDDWFLDINFKNNDVIVFCPNCRDDKYTENTKKF
jgi:hypothetical protein